MYRPFSLFQTPSLYLAGSNRLCDGRNVYGSEKDEGGGADDRVARGVSITRDGKHVVTATSKSLRVMRLQPSGDAWVWAERAGKGEGGMTNVVGGRGDGGGYGSTGCFFETAMTLHDYCVVEGLSVGSTSSDSGAGATGAEGTAGVAVTCRDEPIRIYSLDDSSCKPLVEIRASHHATGEPISAECLGYCAASSLLVAGYNAVASSGGDGGSSARERKGGPVSTIMLYDLARGGGAASGGPVARFVTRATRSSTHGQRGRIAAVAVSSPWTAEAFDYASGAVTTSSFSRGLIAAGSTDGSMWLYDPREGYSGGSGEGMGVGTGQYGSRGKPSAGFASLKGASRYGRTSLASSAHAAVPSSSSAPVITGRNHPDPGVTQVTWSDDGMLLYAGYRYQPPDVGAGILAWDVRRRDKPLLGFEGRRCHTAQKIGFSLVPAAMLLGSSASSSASSSSSGDHILATGSADGRVLFYDALAGGAPLPLYHAAADSTEPPAVDEGGFQPFPAAVAVSPYVDSSVDGSSTASWMPAAVNGVSFGYVSSASTTVMAVATGQRAARWKGIGAVGEKRQRPSTPSDDDEDESSGSASSKAAPQQRTSPPPPISVFGWTFGGPSSDP